MPDSPHVEIYTKDDCPYCENATDLFDSKDVAYTTYNVTGDPELMDEMVERANGRETAPEVFVDGELLGGFEDTQELEATGELDALLGIENGTKAVSAHHPIVIVGSGISGLSAAIYAGRSNNDPLVLEGEEPGGQLTLTTDVANYPGFPEGIGGPELVTDMKSQSTQFGATIENGVVDAVDASNDVVTLTLKNGDVYTADAVIVASGASARTLGIPGEAELMGYGVSTCATCDGAFFRDEEMVVVGGGDAAMEEAAFLTKFAETVYLVHRREGFRAESYWVDRVEALAEDGEIEILKNTEALGVSGSPEDGLDTVSLVRHPAGHPSEKLEDPDTETFELDVAALFIAIGHTPNTEFLEDTAVELDDDGYIVAAGGSGAGQTHTDVEGIFAAGDVVDSHYQQAVTAGGMGCKAAIDADEYLERRTESTDTVTEPESGEPEPAGSETEPRQLECDS